MSDFFKPSNLKNIKIGRIYEAGAGRWIGSEGNTYYYTSNRDDSTQFTKDEAKEFLKKLPKFDTYMFDPDGPHFHFVSNMFEL